jgi:hypothetical protein
MDPKITTAHPTNEMIETPGFDVLRSLTKRMEQLDSYEQEFQLLRDEAETLATWREALEDYDRGILNKAELFEKTLGTTRRASGAREVTHDTCSARLSA